jgi:hypothetical protein
MEEVIARVLENLHGRMGGPMWFRLILQPSVATFLAVKAGMADGRTGRPAYFWAILTDATNRMALLREGWKDVVKVFVLAVVLDAVYQFIVVRWFYPVETLIVAFVLACVPYLLIRGPVGRLTRLKQR